MRNSLIIFIFAMILSCGNAFALPQDWPCDEFILTIAEENSSGGHKFRGQSRHYEATVSNYYKNMPGSVSCGNVGCWGQIKDITTGQEENLYFDCFFNDKTTSLHCYVIDGDEYLLTKMSDKEYRVQICDYYKYLYIDECFGCTCILKDSRGEKMPAI